MSYLGRLAPSPTGRIHLGIAQTSLAAWLDARTAGGRLILRIEDVDRVRCRKDAVSGLVEDLRWLGLDWDGEPERQSARGPLYVRTLARLRSQGRTFACTCTRREVLAASAPHGNADEPPRYPGTCRNAANEADEMRARREPAVRLRTEPEDRVQHTDRRLGALDEDVHQRVGDFILRRSDGLWAYQFAVTVDDLDQGVTCIVRGDDLWDSTGRQLLLRRLLSHGPPAQLETLHVPLVYGPDGKRLAKRDGADSLAALRSRGTPRSEILQGLAKGLDLDTGVRPRHPRDLLDAWAARWRGPAS